MTTQSELVLREGDVFRFAYSDETRKRWQTDPYWCFDGQVVVRDGKLCDTYWGFDAGEPRIVTPDQGELTFICNLNDIRDVRHYETRHYAEADVFNLSYQRSCYKRWAVRKDAQRSQERMLEEIQQKQRDVRQEMESAVRYGANDLSRLGELLAKVQGGDLTVTLWW